MLLLLTNTQSSFLYIHVRVITCRYNIFVQLLSYTLNHRLRPIVLCPYAYITMSYGIVYGANRELTHRPECEYNQFTGFASKSDFILTHSRIVLLFGVAQGPRLYLETIRIGAVQNLVFYQFTCNCITTPSNNLTTNCNL